jgi:hypothetical protein
MTCHGNPSPSDQYANQIYPSVSRSSDIWNCNEKFLLRFKCGNSMNTHRGRLVIVLIGECSDGSQVFLSIIFTFSIFLHHLYHSLLISFFFLTHLLCMLNAYHIISIFIISSSYWFRHICLCLTQQFHFFSSSRLTYFFAFKVPCSDKLLPQQQGSFLPLQFFPHGYGSTYNLCGLMGNSKGEVWVDASHCLYVQVQVQPRS